MDKVVDGFEAWRKASGQSTDEALRSFTLITDGATRFNADVTSVANLAGKLQTNFKLTGAELEAPFDQMAATIGGAPFDEMATNFADMSEDLRKLGIQGSQGTELLTGLFSAVQAKTNDTNKTFERMRSAISQATDPNFLSSRFRGGLLYLRSPFCLPPYRRNTLSKRPICSVTILIASSLFNGLAIGAPASIAASWRIASVRYRRVSANKSIGSMLFSGAWPQTYHRSGLGCSAPLLIQSSRVAGV